MCARQRHTAGQFNQAGAGESGARAAEKPGEKLMSTVLIRKKEKNNSHPIDLLFFASFFFFSLFIAIHFYAHSKWPVLA